MKITYRSGMEEDHPAEIEIPTLQEDDGEDLYYKVDTREDFTLLVDAMGFNSIKEFEQSTGVDAEYLIGKWWMLHGWAGMNKIFIKEGQ